MVANASAGGALLARLDRLPAWPWPVSLLWILGAGYFFAYFDIVNIGAALPEIATQFGVDTATASWAVSAGLAAYIVGAWLDGTIADLHGRRISLIISVSLFAIGSIGAAFSGSLGSLVFWRVVAGLGIGAEIASVTTYISEMAPTGVRGRYTSWAGVFAYAGFAVVPFAARALVPNFAWGWRALFLIGALGGITILFMRRGLGETPRWLIQHGRNVEAEVLVAAAEARVSARIGRPLPAPAAATAPLVHSDFPTRLLFRAPWRGRVLLLLAIWFFYYIGNYGWLEMAPTLLEREGYSLADSLGYLVVTGFGFLAGALLSVRWNDRFERKHTVLVIAIVWAASLGVIGIWPRPAVVMIGGFVASTTIGLLVPVLYTLTAEHFTTRARATGVALTDGFGHVGGALAPILVLWAAGLAGFPAALALMAGSGLVVAALVPFTLGVTGAALEAAEGPVAGAAKVSG